MGTHAKFDFNLPTNEKHVAAYGKIVKTHFPKERETSNWLHHCIMFIIYLYIYIYIETISFHLTKRANESKFSFLRYSNLSFYKLRNIFLSVEEFEYPWNSSFRKFLEWGVEILSYQSKTQTTCDMAVIDTNQ